MAAYLNLSKVIYLTRRPLFDYHRFTFPGGEEHIKIVPLETNLHTVKIVTDFRTSGDLITTFLATDALRELYGSKLQVDLIAPYIPYARQDRRMVPGEPLSLKVVGDLINSQRYRSVHAFDPHSDVTGALINNIQITSNHRLIQASLNLIMEANDLPQDLWNGPVPSPHRNFHDSMCLISPDAGAEKKIFQTATYLHLRDGDVLTATKRRDVTNGKITGSIFEGSVEGKICIIVDDIIDGGRSFTGLGSILKEKGARKVYLIASHGIFSAGFECFRPALDGIYITDSINQIQTDFVTTIPLERVMDI